MGNILHEHAPLMRKYLCGVDFFAKDNVLSGRGGPFAAQLVLFAHGKDQSCTPCFELPISTNRVLETGIASNHAEALAMEPAHIEALKQQIKTLTAEHNHEPLVVLFSSAQPCMACLTKIEICARHLVLNNFIKPKDFILIYGASYEETEKIAGFHDYAYALDFYNYKNNSDAAFHLIESGELPLELAPDHVLSLLNNNPNIESVLVTKDRITGIGFDQRTSFDLFRTSECSALQAASRTLRSEGSQTPWNLQGSSLYTLNPDIGPLSYTECQWASVQKIINLSSDTFCYEKTKGLDCPNCKNHELFRRLSEGYNTPWSMVHVLRDDKFENIGQKEWASLTERVYYNGKETDDPLTNAEKNVFDCLFVPATL